MPLSSGPALLYLLFPALRTLSIDTILVVAMSSTRGWGGCTFSSDSPNIWGYVSTRHPAAPASTQLQTKPASTLLSMYEFNNSGLCSWSYAESPISAPSRVVVA